MFAYAENLAESREKDVSRRHGGNRRRISRVRTNDGSREVFGDPDLALQPYGQKALSRHEAAASNPFDAPAAQPGLRMSSHPRGTALRLLMPSEAAAKIMPSLGSAAKVESSNSTLTAGRLTTEDIVRTIRELTRLRDELFHTMRQLGIPREARKSDLEKPDYNRLLGETQKQLEERRKQYQDAQSRTEALVKQIEEAKRQVAKILEIAEAGFASREALSATGQFSRLLGRLPVKKLEAAQRALRAALKDEAVFSIGNRKKDWVYVLVAVPTDKTPMALQNLILYDFGQTEIPSSDGPDLKTALDSLEKKQDTLTKELAATREEMTKVRGEATRAFNELADNIQDTLITLRGVLKLGEGTKAFHAFAWLEKTPSHRVITSLTAQGAIVEAE